MEDGITPSSFSIMEIIIVIIVALLVCGIVGYCAYKKGYNTTFEIVNYDNTKREYEYNELCRQVQLQQNKVYSLKKEYEEKQAIIDNANERAENEYKARTKLLEERFAAQKQQQSVEFQQQKEKLLALYNEEKQKLQDEITSIQEKMEFENIELKKLSDTKAATIKAFQQEEMVKAQKDSYRLNVGKNDLNDIKVLEAVRPKLNKPRILSMLIWQTFYQPLAKKKFPLILGDKEVCGVYKITNIINDKCYIGQAKDMRKRWLEHCKHGLGIDTPQSNKLYQDMLEYGLENFTFELLIECGPAELNKNEQYYIDVYNAIDYGYNSRNQR